MSAANTNSSPPSDRRKLIEVGSSSFGPLTASGWDDSMNWPVEPIIRLTAAPVALDLLLGSSSMLALFCTILSIGLVTLGRVTSAPAEAVCGWLAGLLATFWVLRTLREKWVGAHDDQTFDRLYDTYVAQFGGMNSGTEFIDLCLPWRQRTDSSLGLLSLFGDWQSAGARRIAIAVSEHLGSKPMEQRLLEDALRSITHAKAKHRRNYSRSIWVTSLAIAVVAIVSQTQCLPPPLGRSAAPVRVQYATAEQAHLVAISRHPKLAIVGSKLNKAFNAHASFYRETRPGYFRDNSWPIRLADTLAAMPLTRS